jgi:hypothetical protein
MPLSAKYRRDDRLGLHRLDVAHHSTDHIYRIVHDGARRVLEVQDGDRPGAAVHAGPFTLDRRSQAAEGGSSVFARGYLGVR